MNLDEIDKKCFILALFIRDDGQRFLLGSGAYEFKDSQLHFSANTMANDVVEVQGNDGYLLAGQVRRPTTQVFDGYIGDASINKPDIEGYRRDFFAFFQKNHFYTVVYIFPDGTSIQRRRGFIVDAGEVRELYQMFPEYHIGLNFEDVNYYKYSEDEDGNEQYAKSIDINISKAVSGGLIWDSVSQTQAYNHGTDFSISGTIEDEPVDHIDLYGDIEQTTYSGKNLWEIPSTSSTVNYITYTPASDGSFSLSGTATADAEFSVVVSASKLGIVAGQNYTFSATSSDVIYFVFNCDSSGTWKKTLMSFSPSGSPITSTCPALVDSYVKLVIRVLNGTSISQTGIKAQFESGNQATSFEPYVGGTASPNPDYPQNVQTVTGRQVVTISDGGSESQEYEINLGKNLCNPAEVTSIFLYNLADKAAYLSENTSVVIPVEQNNSYTVSTTEIQSRYRVAVCDSIPVQGGGDVTCYSGSNIDNTSNSVTINSGIHKYLIVNATDLSKVQIEKGSTATTYAPYFEPIELCKIGDYQDYIYKSGEDWYVHKEIGKYTLDGSLAWYASGSCFKLTNLNTDLGYVPMNSGYVFYPATDSIGLWCNYGIAKSGYKVFQGTEKGVGLGVGGTGGGSTDGIYVTGGSLTLANFQTMLNTSPLVCDYILATPTDTQITNSALIAQLNALNSATTYTGVTWFKTESEYLPADTWAYVQIQAGGGVVWDNYGATWEEGGGGMIVNVNVDSIENVYPVWTVNGPTDTPILTNLTTGTSITYNGNITASQTLVVDMLNQTALLNGTSVIGKLSGDWIELAPGMNRMSYTATNEQTAPKSTLEWQEIVG